MDVRSRETGLSRATANHYPISTLAEVCARDIAETSVAAEELKQFVEWIGRLEEEEEAAADEIKDVFAELKGRGFDVKAVRSILAHRMQEHAERLELEAILGLSMSALGMSR